MKQFFTWLLATAYAVSLTIVLLTIIHPKGFVGNFYDDVPLDTSQVEAGLWA